MTQFEHAVIGYGLLILTVIIFKKYLFFPEEYRYWEKWFDSLF
jgi:hypothetical protein